MLASLGMDYAPGGPGRGGRRAVSRTSRRRLPRRPRPDLGRVRMSVACDVSNPLLGPTGAAAVYGPQKGATADQVAYLDGRLADFADLLEAAGRRPLPVREVAGAGAAGGVGFGLLAIQDAFDGFSLAPRHRPRDGGDRLPGAPGAAPTSSSPARAASTPRPRTARRRWGSPRGRRRRACRASRSVAGSSRRGSRPWRASGRWRCRSSNGRRPSRRRWPRASRPLERCGERLARLVGIGSLAGAVVA